LWLSESAAGKNKTDGTVTAKTIIERTKPNEIPYHHILSLLSFFKNNNKKLSTVVFTKLTKPKWKISKSKIETKLFKVFLYIGTTKTLLKSYNSEKFIQKNSSE
jgi:hypothetical protein